MLVADRDLSFASATRLLELLATGEVTSRRLLDHYLSRIAAYDEAVNTVVALDAGRARAQADAIDDARRAGRALGPLAGLPMTVKDQFATAGLRTASAFRNNQDWMPNEDALVIKRLRAAGAIVFAKTNMAAYGMDVQTYNDWYGTTSNPWDLARTPGGSSGGSAAALAAGFTGLELGGDIAGSVRIPAHCCGVYAHKPTYGIIADPPPPIAPAGYRAPLDIATPGPLARAAEDLELALDVLASPHPTDASAWHLDLPTARHDDIISYRVAAWLDDPACPTDPLVAGVLRGVVDRLGQAGVRVDETARPGFSLAEAFRVFQQLLFATLSNGLPYRALLPPAAAVLRGDSQLSRVVRFGSMRHRDWRRADEARQDLRRSWAAFFEDHDVLICPVSPVVAIPHDHRYGDATIFRSIRGSNGKRRPYTDLFIWPGAIGVAYLPVTAAPVGLSATGLPVGIQIVGPHLQDRTTIDFARRLSQLTGGFTPPPSVQDKPAE